MKWSQILFKHFPVAVYFFLITCFCEPLHTGWQQSQSKTASTIFATRWERCVKQPEGRAEHQTYTWHGLSGNATVFSKPINMTTHLSVLPTLFFFLSVCNHVVGSVHICMCVSWIVSLVAIARVKSNQVNGLNITHSTLAPTESWFVDFLCV